MDQSIITTFEGHYLKTTFSPVSIIIITLDCKPQVREQDARNPKVLVGNTTQ